MATELAHPTALAHVPRLDRALACSDSDLRALRVPVEAGDGVRREFTELENFIVVGVPEVKRGVESD